MAKTMDTGGRARGRWNPVLWGGAGLLLLLPLVAMQLTDEVNWTAFDFIVFGALLAVALGGWELASRRIGRRAWRVVAAIAIVAAFLLVWASLAVGL
ncbi:hypothetical protein [uncultured Brevundimonas sp.]|uniref:hypothetical protein n=1 Tax=uncultured Brevundimonas sp. TaxID=213418 RepID=UPI0030ECF2E9